MWIDINAYIGHWPYKQLHDSTLTGLIDRMDWFGIDKAVVAHLDGVHFKNSQSANEAFFAQLKSEKSLQKRIIPFAVINPAYPGWEADLKKCISNGIAGVRLYPQYHDYLPEDPACVALVRKCRDANLVVGLTTRMVDSRQRSWLDLPNVAGTEIGEWSLRQFMPLVREVPEATYFFLNVANGLAVAKEDAALLKSDKIIFDTSGRSLGFMPDLVQQYGAGKFAFGSHSPLLDYVTGMLRIESLRDSEATPAQKDQMRSGNAIRLLGTHIR